MPRLPLRSIFKTHYSKGTPRERMPDVPRPPDDWLAPIESLAQAPTQIESLTADDEQRIRHIMDTVFSSSDTALKKEAIRLAREVLASHSSYTKLGVRLKHIETIPCLGASPIFAFARSGDILATREMRRGQSFVTTYDAQTGAELSARPVVGIRDFKAVPHKPGDFIVSTSDGAAMWQSGQGPDLSQRLTIAGPSRAGGRGVSSGFYAEGEHVYLSYSSGQSAEVFPSDGGSLKVVRQDSELHPHTTNMIEDECQPFIAGVSFERNGEPTGARLRMIDIKSGTDKPIHPESDLGVFLNLNFNKIKLLFDLKGQFVYSQVDGIIDKWCVSTGEPAKGFSPDVSGVNRMRTTSCGHIIVACDSGIHILSAATGKSCGPPLPKPMEEGIAFNYDPKDNTLQVPTKDGIIRYRLIV